MDPQLMTAILINLMFEPFVEQLFKRTADLTFDQIKLIVSDLKSTLSNDSFSGETSYREKLKHLVQVAEKRYGKDRNFRSRYDSVAREWNHQEFLRRVLTEMLRPLNGADLSTVAGSMAGANYPDPRHVPNDFKNQLIHDLVYFDPQGKRLMDLLDNLHNWKPDVF